MSNAIHIGNLPGNVTEDQVNRLFQKYGKIESIRINNKRSHSTGFVVYNDKRQAQNAVHGRDKYDVDGRRILVEITRESGSRVPPRSRPRDQGHGNYGHRDQEFHGQGFRDQGFRGQSFSGQGFRGNTSRGNFSRGGRGGGGAYIPNQPRNGFKVIVDGLPPTGSWQDIKDLLRDAGDVCYATVNEDGTGVVAFSSQEGVKNAIRKFDNTKFISHKDETSYIRLREDRPSFERDRPYTGKDRSSCDKERSSSGSSRRSRDRTTRVTRTTRQRTVSRSRSPISRSPQSRASSKTWPSRSCSPADDLSRSISRPASPESSPRRSRFRRESSTD